MKNILVIREYIKESINENVLEDDLGLSYVDHLKKLKLEHRPNIELILKEHIYSNNRFGGTSAHKYFNSQYDEQLKVDIWSSLPYEGGAAIDDIFSYLPPLPYVEDGLDDLISSMISDKIYSFLLEDILELSQNEHRFYENRIFKIIRKTADAIVEEWSIIYLKKKKILTEYIANEDPIKKITDSLQLAGSKESEQLDYLVKNYFNQYYEDVTSSPETSLQDLKDSLSYYIDVD